MTDETVLLFVFNMYLPTVKINVLSIRENLFRHQVHLGINHVTSVLLNTLVDIMFAVFKK